MIGKLNGIIDTISGNILILDVNGVGYVVQASNRTLAKIGMAGDKTSVLIETIVREESITLFGFADMLEQHWFRTLTTVQGVGPKVCLAILSACPPEQLSMAIAAKDTAALTRADGVGPKLATRIVTELKDKAAGLADIKIVPSATQAVKGKKQANDEPAIPVEDAISALINLGYGRTEAYAAVNTVIAKGVATELSRLITESLKELAA